LQLENNIIKEEIDFPGFPFLYGTHYSVPTNVIFFILRSHPLYHLRLQGGSFDHADRLFQSMKLSWETVCSPESAAMELIPEFYSGDGSFLVNTMDLNLGKLQSGTTLGNVILPKWANVSLLKLLILLISLILILK
jgi:hypothetical protein